MDRRAFLKTSAALAAAPAAFSAAPAQVAAAVPAKAVLSGFASTLKPGLEAHFADVYESYAAQYQHVQYGYRIIMERDHLRVERI